MNNKKIGTAFENKMCEILANKGFWVHFITPDRTGAQPFDIIAVKKGRAYAIDCKTCENHIFSISRLEVNQMLAFEKWIDCGNYRPLIAVEHNGEVSMIAYSALLRDRKIDLEGLTAIMQYDDILECMVMI